MSEITLGIRKFRPGTIMPRRGTALAAGIDICAWIMRNFHRNLLESPDILPENAVMEGNQVYVPDQLSMRPGEVKIIKTGLNVRIPAGYEVQIRSRSGLAAKHGIHVLNSPGTIDADFDGDGESFELGVTLHYVLNLKDVEDNVIPGKWNPNHKEPFRISHGDRIAQMILKPILDWDVEEVFGDNLSRHESERTGGIGSTGRT